MANVKKLKINGTVYDIKDAGAQRTLTAGTNISIDANNVISATGADSDTKETLINPLAGSQSVTNSPALELHSSIIDNDGHRRVNNTQLFFGANSNGVDDRDLVFYKRNTTVEATDEELLVHNYDSEDDVDTYNCIADLRINRTVYPTKSFLTANHYTKTEVDNLVNTTVGDIESILQEINGTNS